MSMRSLSYSVLLLGLVLVEVRAQAPEAGRDAWLRVQSNLPTSLVLVDSVYAGRAAGAALRVSARGSRVVLVPTEVGAWDLTQPESFVTFVEGDTLDLILNFPYQYRIDSSPFGAIVSVPSEGQRILGTTPLVYSTEVPLLSVLLLEKAGYANDEVVPGQEVINRHSVSLRPLDVDLADNQAVEWTTRSSKNKWVNWVAAGLVVTGGALAVHFKFTADDEYELYLDTGDPAIKAQVDQYDRYSYIALAGMQVGIGILVFRLAF